MKLNLSRSCFLLALAAVAPARASNTSPYTVSKAALFIQKTPDSATASTKYPYAFSVQAPTASTLTLPGGSTQAVAFTGGNGDYEIDAWFASKAAMDAAYPDGTYTLAGAAIPSLSYAMTPDSYPAATPTVTGSTGTWSGGVLMIDPSASATIDFSDFTTFASGGVGGFMEFKIVDLSENAPSLDQQEVTMSNAFGIPVGSTSRTVLIQALGPALAGEGVTGVLQQPVLSIYNTNGQQIYSNTGWGSSQILLNAAATVYASPVLLPGSPDSELLLTLPPGGYTAEVSGINGGTGVALCAIYQLP